MRSTMQDAPLTTTSILHQAERVFATAGVGTYDGEQVHRRPLGEIATGARRLASGLRALGVEPDDRVATLCWNHSRHLEAYYAVPGIGAVLHTLNLRLAPEQIRDIVRHAGDSVLLVDARLAPLLEPIAAELAAQLRQVVVLDDELPDPPPVAVPFDDTVAYEDVLAAGSAAFEFPDVDERSAAILCYTTGTTGSAEGRRLQPPLDLAALARRLLRQRATGSASATASCSPCRCSTPTPGACPLPPGWSAPTMLPVQAFLQRRTWRS